jgi:5-methylcytosine-specific restriction endonuclease McrA
MKPCRKCGGTERDVGRHCKACKKAYDAAWQKANIERKRASDVARRKANPDKFKAQFAAYRKANPDKSKAAVVAWRKENPEATRIYSHNKRARKRANGGKLSKGLAERLLKLQRGKCACGCGQTLGDDYHLDHRMPLALGGANEDLNMQLLTSTCNQQKHAKHPVDFMQSRGFLL